MPPEPSKPERAGPRITRTTPDSDVPASLRLPAWRLNSLLQRLVILAFVLPVLVLVSLLERGDKTAAACVLAGIVAVGGLVVIAIRRANTKRATVEAARVARRAGAKQRALSRRS